MQETWKIPGGCGCDGRGITDILPLPEHTHKSGEEVDGIKDNDITVNRTNI